ncbi:MAG: trimethylamine--corrinoid methyltransferase [Thermovirgaceae bacterium]|nr:trimethylamine--corrinoid methyltransferase [Thermovirgaceae bacterium]
MGLWGEPEEEKDQYMVYEIEGRPGMKCHIKKDVFEWMEQAGPMPEGDYLFMVEGVGRLRFRIV